MSALVFGLVALAAVLHVAWNVLLKTTGDPLRTSSRAVTAGLVAALPLCGVGWLVGGRPGVPAEAILLALASGLAEVAYFVFLSAAYQRGDLSLVYPIARGSAPLLAVASGVLVLGERLGPGGAVGVLALLAGILMIRRPWGALLPLFHRSGVAAQAGQADPRRTEAGPSDNRPAGPRPSDRRRVAPGLSDSRSAVPPPSDPRGRQAVLLALATGAMIATYSSIDRVGARLTEPWLYATLLWAVAAVGLWVWIRTVDTFRIRRIATVPADLPDEPGDAGDAEDTSDGSGRSARSIGGSWPRSIVIGLLLLGAYLLILVAFRLAPLTAVAPLRESAVVLASGWGAFRLGEGSSRRDALLRLGGAALIVVGAVLLALED